MGSVCSANRNKTENGYPSTPNIDTVLINQEPYIDTPISNKKAMLINNSSNNNRINGNNNNRSNKNSDNYVYSTNNININVNNNRINRLSTSEVIGKISTDDIDAGLLNNSMISDIGSSIPMFKNKSDGVISTKSTLSNINDNNLPALNENNSNVNYNISNPNDDIKDSNNNAELKIDGSRNSTNNYMNINNSANNLDVNTGQGSSYVGHRHGVSIASSIGMLSSMGDDSDNDFGGDSDIEMPIERKDNEIYTPTNNNKNSIKTPSVYTSVNSKISTNNTDNKENNPLDDLEDNNIISKEYTMDKYGNIVSNKLHVNRHVNDLSITRPHGRTMSEEYYDHNRHKSLSTSYFDDKNNGNYHSQISFDLENTPQPFKTQTSDTLPIGVQ
mmetsp:Transcript_62366/g.76382  ORF Transcript_62366/g.76382 Transcript_62366/m.76382 type:complete len:387 (-) Transcript_62366:370-1530(-)